MILSYSPVDLVLWFSSRFIDDFSLGVYPSAVDLLLCHLCQVGILKPWWFGLKKKRSQRMRQWRSPFPPIFFSLTLQPNGMIMTSLCVWRLEILAFAHSLGLGIFRRIVPVQLSNFSFIHIAFLGTRPSSQVSVDGSIPSITVCFFKPGN